MDFEGDLTELYFVIENMEPKLKEKIPNKLLEEIKRRINVNSLRYIVGLDLENLSDTTKGYLSYIYTKYLCDDEDEIEKWNQLDEMYLKMLDIFE